MQKLIPLLFTIMPLMCATLQVRADVTSELKKQSGFLMLNTVPEETEQIRHDFDINGNEGTVLVNEDFSSNTSFWKQDDGKLWYKKGKCFFEDLGNSGWSKLTYDLPRNLKNEDFQLTMSIKVSLENKQYLSLNFYLGSDWYNSYLFGLCNWDNGKIILSYGDNKKYNKYYGYSGDSNLNPSVTHQYTMIKKGENVEWYADGKLLCSTKIDLFTDMNSMGFLVGGHHMIEIDDIKINLL